VAALASKLAAKVVALEISDAMAQQAQKRFNELELANLIQRTADGSAGAPELGPYDRIFVATPKVTDKAPLIAQLADGGQLLAIEQGENETLILTRYEVNEPGVKNWPW
jgi:type IV pilus assembly protein PilB